MSTSNSVNNDALPEVFAVKVGKQPGIVTLKKVPAGATAADALQAAELDPADHELRVNGVPANLDQALRPGDAVLLFKPLAGNNDEDLPEVFAVKVGKQPGIVTLKKVPAGATAADALQAAELDPADHELRVNGVPANLDRKLRPGDAVLLFKPLAGNC